LGALTFAVSSAAFAQAGGAAPKDSKTDEGYGYEFDDDPIALRHQIWLATDEAYKAAGQAFTEKQAALKQFSTDVNPVDDFARAPVVTALSPTVKLEVDESAWRKTIEDASALYRQYPDVQSVSAAVRFSAINEYLVNSEGTVTRNGKRMYSVQLNSTAQAADGMRLSRNPFWMVAKAEELPSREKLLTETRKMLDTVVALRQAPIVEEDYRGPVLFAPDAANDVIASLVGVNILGRKPQLRLSAAVIAQHVDILEPCRDRAQRHAADDAKEDLRGQRNRAGQPHVARLLNRIASHGERHDRIDKRVP